MKLPKIFDGSSFTRWGRTSQEHTGEGTSVSSATNSESSEERSLVTPDGDRKREGRGSFDAKSLSGSIASFLSLHKTRKPENRSSEKMEGTWREMMSSVFSGFGRRASLRGQNEPEVSPKLRRSNTMPARRASRDTKREDASSEGVSQGQSTEYLLVNRRGETSTQSLRTTSNTLDGFSVTYTTIQSRRSLDKTSDGSSHTESDLSRSSSVLTLRNEDFEQASHYQSVSEAVSWCPSLTDLTSSDATPTASPYCTIASNRRTSHDCCIYHSPSSHQLPSIPTAPSNAIHPPSRNLTSLLDLLNSLSDSRSESIQGIKRDITAVRRITSRQYIASQYSPPSSVTSSGSQCCRCGGEGGQVRTQGHTCPKCQVNFLTSDQLLEHWSIFHTHEILDAHLSPLHHYQWKKEEEEGREKVEKRGSIRKRPLIKEERESWSDAYTPTRPLSPDVAVQVRKLVMFCIWFWSPLCRHSPDTIPQGIYI